MKTLLFILLLSAGAALGAEADKGTHFALKGAIVMPGDKVYLNVLDLDSGNLVRWVPVGAKLRESVTVSAYDPVRSVATLTVGAEKVELHLEAGRILDAKEEAPKLLKGVFAITDDSGGTISSVTDQLHFGVATRIYAGPGRTLEVTPTLQENGMILFSSTLETIDANGVAAKAGNAALITLPDKPISVRIRGVVGFNFTP